MDILTAELSTKYGQLAMGWGNASSGIMFVADAPGKQELLTGEPFSGVSGRFFDELLSSISLRRDDIYLTNVVKFRPENRQPNKKEIADFQPLLAREIALIQPKVIVSLGSLSLDYFLPKVKVSEVHGMDLLWSAQDFKCTLVPLYHPAAAMHNGQMRPLLKRDFLKLQDVLLNLDLL